jgi:hypothetical protein
MSNRSDEPELRDWLKFFGNLALECMFIAAWATMVWALHERVVKKLALEGIAKLMVQGFEILFYASTLYKLLRFMFRPRRRSDSYRSWWL